MVRARLSSKGQITVPQEIRERYGLQEGDEVEFIAEDKGPYMVPLKRKNLMDLYGTIKPSRPAPPLVDARKIARARRAKELDRKAKRP